MKERNSNAVHGERSYMKVFAGVAFAMLMVMFVIVATRAKYVTSEEGNATARVAKFDVSTNLNDGSESQYGTFGLFDTVYDTDGSEEDDVWNNTEDGYNVIAPGTQGAFEIAYENNSEVSVAYGTEFTVTNNSGIPIEFATVPEDHTEEVQVYCWLHQRGVSSWIPCVGGTCHVETVTHKEADWTSDINDLGSVLAGNIEKTTGKASQVIYWRWVFEADRDDADTVLGMNAVENDITVDVAAEVTFTQID